MEYLHVVEIVRTRSGKCVPGRSVYDEMKSPSECCCRKKKKKNKNTCNTLNFSHVPLVVTAGARFVTPYACRAWECADETTDTTRVTRSSYRSQDGQDFFFFAIIQSSAVKSENYSIRVKWVKEFFFR